MKRFVCAIVILSALLTMAVAQSTKRAGTKSQNKASSSNLQPAAATNPVTGSGTTGRISKWGGVFGSDTFTLGDSIVFEDKFGKVGIGTDSPTSKLTVQGIVENTLGGFKFPDGTIQTTAAVSGLTSIFRDPTLQGNGASASPLGIAPGAVGTFHLANNAVTGAKIANGSVVRSLNGLLDNVQFAAGSNITITPSGSTLTIAAPNLLSSVTRNGTLQGNGASGSPLGLAVPLSLTGNVPGPFSHVVDVVNSGAGGIGMRVQGGGGTFAGNGINVFGGDGVNNGGRGVVALGGSGLAGGTGVNTRGGSGGSGSGGRGVDASGGSSDTGGGGTGVHAFGGASTSGFGGSGVFAAAGDGDSSGGTGVVALGGNAANGLGGDGLFAHGGINSNPSSIGGTGAFVFGGDAINGATPGLAGDFRGNVVIRGNLFVSGTKNFMIDHPLDPENKYLYHAAIESSEVLNVYSGNVTTNENGEATVSLPDWFEALNSDFRYQLTAIATFAQAIIAEKIKDNRFTIRTNAPGVEVSWQVTGVRSDAAMRKHPFKAEGDKLERERGFYVSPEAFNQPEERGVDWAHHPEMMQQMKETRLKKIEELKQKARSNDR